MYRGFQRPFREQVNIRCIQTGNSATVPDGKNSADRCVEGPLQTRTCAMRWTLLIPGALVALSGCDNTHKGIDTASIPTNVQVAVFCWDLNQNGQPDLPDEDARPMTKGQTRKCRFLQQVFHGKTECHCPVFEGLELQPRFPADTFQDRAFLAYHNALLAIALDPDYCVNRDAIVIGLESLEWLDLSLNLWGKVSKSGAGKVRSQGTSGFLSARPCG